MFEYRKDVMLVGVDFGDGLVRRDDEFRATTFRDLELREADIEEFIRNNIEVLFASENSQDDGSESLLIVGQQVIDAQGRRSDLTAVDGNGSLTLIEIKRDIGDMERRREPLEFQAIRYAASLATIETPDQLVELVYAPYVERRQSEEFSNLGNLTSSEFAKRKLDTFLEGNNAFATFNQKQRIVLAASEFDRQTLSAVAWLISNRVDISCFTLTPGKLLGKGFIDVRKVLPPPALEDCYVTLQEAVASVPRRSTRNAASNARTRQTLQKIPDLLDAGLLSVGDTLVIRDEQGSQATVIDASQVEFEGRRLTYNKWGQQVKGWSSINIYDWAIHKASDKTLGELRQEMMDSVDEPSVTENPINGDAILEEEIRSDEVDQPETP